MYATYYGLREEPFGVTPDPRFLFLTKSHREALASLVYGIESGRGFLGLIATPGMGKTSLLYNLLEKLKDSTKKVFLFQTQCDSREFVRYLLHDLGFHSPDQDMVRLHKELNDIVINESRAGRRLVLIVDEAQNLEDEVLETIRLLSNFETPSQKLMQIVLSGQPQLADKLARPKLEQLRQRISVLSRINPLSPSETVQYIDHRLQVAGYTGPPLFTPQALRTIIAHCEGIPRNINSLCFSALSIGFALNRKQIDHEILAEAIRDLGLKTPLRELRDPFLKEPAIAAPPRVLQSRPPAAPAHSGGGRRFGLVDSVVILAGAIVLITLGTAFWKAGVSRDLSTQQSQSALPSRPESAAPPAYASQPTPPEAPITPVHGEPINPSVPDSQVKSNESATPETIVHTRVGSKKKKISTLCERADAYLNRGQYEQAVRDYEKALSLDPTNQSIRSKLKGARRAWETEREVLQ